jgi:hypothetical protein
VKAKASRVVLFGMVAAGLVGCATAQSPVPGMWYSDVRGPVMATDAHGGTAKGEACANSILGLVATGDASIDTAKKNGGIAQVVAIDHHSTSILGVMATYCTIVYGKRGGGGSKRAQPAAADEG